MVMLWLSYGSSHEVVSDAIADDKKLPATNNLRNRSLFFAVLENRCDFGLINYANGGGLNVIYYEISLKRRNSYIIVNKSKCVCVFSKSKDTGHTFICQRTR